MDIDLDDLSFEEDDYGYDPEEDEEEAPGLEVIGYTEHEEEEQEKKRKISTRIDPEWTDVEKIQLLMEHMPGNRKVLMRIMQFCIEPKTISEVDDYIYDLQRSNYSVYTPVSLRRLLQDNKALDYIPPEEPEDEEEDLTYLDEILEEKSDEEIEEAINAAAEVNEDGEVPEDVALAAAVLTADISDNDWNEAIIVDEPEYDVIKPRPEGQWVTTDAGIEYLEQDSPSTRLQDILDRDNMYVDIYMRILEYCAESPKRMVVIEKHFGEELSHRKPRKYASFFITELEKCDVIDWDEAWFTTDFGKEILEKWRNGQTIIETLEEDYE